MGAARRVALDPAVQFGQPVIFKFGIRTESLYLAAKAGSEREEIADWYEVAVEDVNDAVEFETQLAAFFDNNLPGFRFPKDTLFAYLGDYDVPVLRNSPTGLS